MRIACVSKVEELGTNKVGVALLPEYANPEDVKQTALLHPNAIVIAALRVGIRSKGYLVHQVKNRIRYLKVGTDGIGSKGTGIVPTLPVYELPDICVGVLICMDVQCGAFVRKVVARVASSASKVKIVCIPAYMETGWFNGEALGLEYQGVHVALSNHPDQGRPRCKSFIADTNRIKVSEQRETEPLHFEIPFSRKSL